MDPDIFLYGAIGFGAQLVDGALGMGFGVISSTVLLSTGVPPSIASASVHAAKSFTNGAAGLSHAVARNIDWKLCAILGSAGIVGGIAGAGLLSWANPDYIRPFVAAYLILMGLLILVRAWRRFRPTKADGTAAPVGLIAGFLDAVGGGGWGPITTSTLIGRGGDPRYVIGSVTMSECFVSIAVVAALASFGQVNDMNVVIGLVGGGLIAAPVAGYSVRFLPQRGLMIGVGVLVIVLASLMIWQLATK